VTLHLMACIEELQVNTESLNDAASPEMDSNGRGNSEARVTLQWTAPTLTRLALSHSSSGPGGNDDNDGLSCGHGR